MKRIKSWNWTLILCVALLLVNLWQGKRISELESAIWNVQNSVMSSVSSLSGQVSSISYNMEHADDMVLDWDYAARVVMDKRRLDVDVTVELKEWTEDTVVKVIWKNLYGEELEGVATLTGNLCGGYSGTLDLPSLERLNEITLTAVIEDGVTNRREDLGSLGPASELFPLQCYGYGIAGPVYSAREGTFAVYECDAELNGKALDLDRVTGQTFRLTRNGKTVAEQAAKAGDRLDTYTCGELSTEVQPGDEVLLTFCCQDGNGLNYEFLLDGWAINESGFGTVVPEGEYPKLTWN